MKASIVTMTQQLAKDYLSRNLQNRKIKKSALNFYKNQMIKGEWKENGEPIIIDVNGVVKDGQHRLMAVAETGYAYRVPVISGVNENVMDTIDTGANRSASDVLELEGFKYSALTAGIAKLCLSERLTEAGKHFTGISNSDILEFANTNKPYLKEICKKASEISSLQVLKVLPPSFIGYYIYTYGNTIETEEFLKLITGTIRIPKSATDYVYKKLAKSKSGDFRLSNGDKHKYIVASYLKYKQGNPKVTRIIINKTAS